MENNYSCRVIDGELFSKIIVNGALNLKANLKTVNDLNVFPIPDGDTGDNMYMTLLGGVDRIKGTNEKSVYKNAETLAQGMLISARGNSGVILSQLFAGIAEGLKGFEKVTIDEFCKALTCGVEKAYKSVAKPVEGTMLTVIREAVEFVCKKCQDNSTIGGFLCEFVEEMKRSLERTPDMLAVLKEAGVVDSGGAGLLYIAEGMKYFVDGVVQSNEEVAVSSSQLDLSKFNEDSVMEYGYCTELLLQLQTVKTNVNNFDLASLISFLESIGDSVVAFINGTMVKVHVHTLTPSKVLEYCQTYGEFLTVKIENMTLQHSGVEKPKQPEKRKRPRRKFATVTVVNGKGLEETFKEIGADEVIYGGQGKNPSIERFIEAFDQVNADNIFVLPNNSNIIMAAKQARDMYDKSNVEVIETKDIGQAYSILSMLDYSLDDAKEIANQMREDMQGIVTGHVTRSIRDASIDGVDICQGEYIGFSDKTMLTSRSTKIDALLDVTDKLGAKQKNFMIISYGETVSESEKTEIAGVIKEKYPTIEFYEINGEQEVYDFIIILE